jgi:hypothetical protein
MTQFVPLFATYGDLKEAVFITNKSKGPSKDYRFVAIYHAGSAILTPKERSKRSTNVWSSRRKTRCLRGRGRDGRDVKQIPC